MSFKWFGFNPSASNRTSDEVIPKFVTCSENSSIMSQHTAGKSSASGALGAITQNKVSLQLATSALYRLKLLWYTTLLVKSHE